MKKYLVGITLLLSACGHQGELPAQIADMVRNGKTQEALDASKDLYTDEPSAVARALNVGTLHFMTEDYYAAVSDFKAAAVRSRELYTTSVSKTVASKIVGDGITDYVGENYELSLLRFYTALANYKLAEKGYYEVKDETGVVRKDLDDTMKRQYRQGFRAALRDWDYTLRTFSNDSKGKDFSVDMLEKTFGGDGQSLSGGSNERQIARVLYRNAEDLAGKLPYPSLQGENAEKLKQYAKENMKKLSSPDNVKLVFAAGVIEPKYAEKVKYRIPFYLFASTNRSCLDWILPGQSIDFEMPAMKKPASASSYRVVVKTSDGQTKIEKDLVLTEPVSEIAYAEFEKRKAGIYTGKITSLGAKYAAAAIAACSTYKKDDFASGLTAWGTFAASSALISASEYADVRMWNLLPHAVYQQSFSLKKGDYIAQIYKGDRKVAERSFKISGGNPILLDIFAPMAENISNPN